MYEQTVKDNLKLGGLGQQMGEMDRDFEEMMRLRNDAKRRLELQFKDVYQKIKDNKQYTIDEGKKVNDQLKQFQDEYLRLLGELTEQLNTRVKEETDYMEAERVRGHDRMAALENMVRQEREDRINSLESQLNPIRANLRGIESGIDAERNARVQKEREIIDTLHEESAKIEEALTIEKEERLARQRELYERITQEIRRENEWIEAF